jgi:hypothetical protein
MSTIKCLSACITCIMIGSLSAAAQERIVMKIGGNASAFHQEYMGQTYQTFESRGFGDWWYRYHSMVTAMFSLTSSKPNEEDRPALRLIEVRNALAVVYDRQRYILLGNWGGDSGGDFTTNEMLIFGHELGHHFCGHTIGIAPESSWDRELEADRFAGAAANALSRSSGQWKYELANLNYQTVMDAANNVYGPMISSQSHPPANLRIAAVQDGWLKGSPCLEHSRLGTPPVANTGGTVPLGSVRSLLDDMVAQSVWAIGVRANCRVPGKRYSLRSSGVQITWQSGIGDIDVESIDSTDANALDTTTTRSQHSDGSNQPAGQTWRYARAGNDISVSTGRGSRFSLVRCP